MESWVKCVDAEVSQIIDRSYSLSARVNLDNFCHSWTPNSIKVFHRVQMSHLDHSFSPDHKERKEGVTLDGVELVMVEVRSFDVSDITTFGVSRTSSWKLSCVQILSLIYYLVQSLLNKGRLFRLQVCFWVRVRHVVETGIVS